MSEGQAAARPAGAVQGSVQVPETYGWPFASAGALSLAFSIGPFVAAATSNYRPMDSDRQAGIGFAAAGVAALAWEFWRRRRRVVLAPVRGGLGVYHDGVLQNVAAAPQITLYRWSDRYRIAYIGLLFYLVVMAMATMGMNQAGGKTAYDLLLGVLAGLWVLSHVWVRSSLTRLWLPIQPGKIKSVLVHKRLLPLLFTPAGTLSPPG